MSDALGADLLDRSCSIPDPQLVWRIVSQVEFYLSDENLAKDAFLLKHVQKNKMGFVRIKLLTSFKKAGGSRCRPAGLRSGLHVEGVRVSGCPLAASAGVYGEVQVAISRAHWERSPANPKDDHVAWRRCFAVVSG